MSDEIAVMQSGKIVETGPAEEVYTRPVHEYTKTLLTSVPIPDPREMETRKADRRRHAPHWPPAERETPSDGGEAKAARWRL
jgi:ABC-type oligopeptide transport system ATPase subunit